MEYIAVLDLGTSKMLAAAASKDNRSAIVQQQTPTDGSIRRGLIADANRVSAQVAELLPRLANSLDADLTQIYIGIGGQSLRTELFTATRKVETDVIGYDLMDKLEQDCWQAPDGCDLLDVLPADFYVDGRLEPYPEGCEAETLEIRCLRLIGRTGIKSDREEALSQAKVGVAGIVIAPLATATAALTAKEKAVGCVLVEAGAGLTCLSVYKEGMLRHLVTLPLGGDAITQDIVGELHTSAAEAESLKKNCHAVLDTASPAKEGIAAQGRNDNGLSDDETLTSIIEARIAELAANLAHQIKLAACTDLDAGLVLTGGAAQLPGLKEAIEEKTQLKVRLADTPELSCALGMLQMGNEVCAETRRLEEIFKPEPVETPPAKNEPDRPSGTTGKDKAKKKITGFIEDLFNMQ